MPITIYFGNKPLILQESKNYDIGKSSNEDEITVAESINSSDIEKVLHQIQQPEIKGGIVAFNPDQSLQAISKHFQVIQAAGGLVHDGSGQILLIFRRGKWDLPKGKLDEGEKLEDCAVREVEEETGLKDIELAEKICVTYHTYFQDGAHILKESHWYLMQSDSNQALTPQLDEDIEECKWENMENIAFYMENTHPSIRDVLAQGLALLSKREKS